MTARRSITARAGTNLGGASAHNRRVVIDALRLNGALSRAELARSTRLTPQTVSNIVGELSALGLVSANEPVKLARGQPATPYRLVPGGAFAIGLHIDRHYTRAVAVNFVGEPLVKLGRPLPEGGPEEGIGTVLALLKETRAELDAVTGETNDRLVGLGIAMPGPFGVPRGGDDQWMMAKWQAYPLVDTVTSATGLQTRLLNDATAATIAEKLTGAAHGLDDLVYIFLGYGLGAGIMINGDIYDGAHGNAGEIGEMLMRVPCLGETGSAAAVPTPVEHDASLASLARLLDLPEADPHLFDRLEDALDRADPRLSRWVDIAAQQLRRSVQIIESIFDPETVILGGEAPRRLMRQLADRMQPLLPSVAERPDRKAARLILGGADRWAVALGAATEPISRQFDPRFSAILKAHGIDRS